MTNLTQIKKTILDNKTVLGHKVVRLGGLALGAFIAGAVLTKTHTEPDVVVVDGDVIVDEANVEVPQK